MIEIQCLCHTNFKLTKKKAKSLLQITEHLASVFFFKEKKNKKITSFLSK